MSRRIRVAVLLLAVVMVAACGGTEEPSGSTVPGSQNTTPGTQGQGTTSTSTGPSGGVSEGTVTIENETFEFEGNKFPGSCDAPNNLGGVGVALHLLGAAGSGSETSEGLELILVPEGADAYKELEKIEVRLAEADGRRWIVNEGQDSGSIDSWAFEGSRIVGTATFYSTHEDRLVPGSFDVVCGDS
jgi:hypothetical protein